MAFNRERALASAAKFAGRGQHDRAAREYQSIVEADPSDIRSWVMLADCLVRAGDNPGAIDRFTKVAAFYAENDEPTKAVAVYRQILNLDASRLDIHVKIAELLHSLGRTPDAIATYEFVAQSYFQAGKVAEGLEGFRMVAELDVGAVAKRLRVAELYSREGRKDAAVEHFRLAAARLLAKNRYDDYIRVGERLLYHKDDDADILRSLAELYLVHAKEPRRALMKLNGLLRVSPNDALGLELLADTFVALGKKDKAISVATELAKELRKGDAESKREATRILRKALDWGPESPDALNSALAEVEAEVAALGAGEPEVLIDVADDLDDELDLDVDIDEGGDDFEIDETEELGDDGYDIAMTAAQKLVVETQVYVRYKMFEHALAHIDGLLEIEPSDLDAIEMRADVFDRMGRHQDAADLYVHLAQLVGEEDASKAERFLDQALALVPDHAKASMMLTTLEAVGRGSGRRPILAELRADKAQVETKTEVAAKPVEENAAAQSVAQERAPEAKNAAEAAAAAEKAAAEKAAAAKVAAEKAAAEKAEKKAADARMPLFGGGTPLPSLLPTREGRTPLPGRPRGATPLPDILPRRDGTPAPGVAPKREAESTSEAPVTTDDSGLLRFSAPKKRPPPPPPPGRGRRRSPSSDRRAVDRARSSDSDSSEGESEPSQAREQREPGPETVEIEEVEELDVMEILEVEDFEEDEDEDESGDGASASEQGVAAEADSSDEAAAPGADAAEADSSEAAAPEAEAEVDAADAEATTEAEAEAREDDAPSGRPALGFLPTRGRPGRRVRRRESAKLAAAEPAAEPAVESAAESAAPAGDASQETASVEEPAERQVEAAESDIIEDVLRSDDVARSDAASPVEVAESSTGEAEAQLSEAEADAASSETEADAESHAQLSETEGAEVEAAPEVDEASEAETSEAETSEAETSEAETSEAETSQADAEAQPSEAERETVQVEASEAESEAQLSERETEAAQAETTEASESQLSEAETETAQPESTEAESETAQAEVATEAEDVSSESKTDVEAAQAEETTEASESAEPEAKAESSEPKADLGPLEGDTLEGLAEEVEAEDAAAAHPDITDELDELKFFIEQEFDDDAAVAYLELVGRYPGHPALEPFAERFTKLGESSEEAAAPVLLGDEEGLLLEQSGDSLEAPVFDFEENDEEDDFLSSIFDDEPSPAKSKKADPPRARAELDGNADARTLFDLGTAYREMGLIDDALTQFRAASRDSEWKARSLVMMASLHLHRGALPEAIADLEEAVAFANTDDERSEARYELGVIYQVMGENEKAIAALEAVNAGYRDRDARLATLGSA